MTDISGSEAFHGTTSIICVLTRSNRLAHSRNLSSTSEHERPVARVLQRFCASTTRPALAITGTAKYFASQVRANRGECGAGKTYMHWAQSMCWRGRPNTTLVMCLRTLSQWAREALLTVPRARTSDRGHAQRRDPRSRTASVKSNYARADRIRGLRLSLAELRRMAARGGASAALRRRFSLPARTRQSWATTGSTPTQGKIRADLGGVINPDTGEAILIRSGRSSPISTSSTRSNSRNR